MGCGCGGSRREQAQQTREAMRKAAPAQTEKPNFNDRSQFVWPPKSQQA